MAAIWIETHANLLTHPKVDRLANEFQLPRSHALGILVGMWLWASQYAEDGNLSKYRSEEIAKGIGWTDNSENLIEKLTKVGFLDECNAQLLIHDWEDYGTRLLKQSRERQRRYRGKQSSASVALNAMRNKS